jgi:hypothetical protein
MFGSINLISKTNNMAQLVDEDPISTNKTTIEIANQLIMNSSESISDSLTDDNKTRREDLLKKILLGSRAYYALEDVQKGLKSKV